MSTRADPLAVFFSFVKPRYITFKCCMVLDIQVIAVSFIYCVLCGKNYGTITLKYLNQGSNQGQNVSMWSSHDLPVSTWVLSGYSGFLPHSKNMQTGGYINCSL